MGQLPNMLYLASIWVIPVVIAITFHEAAHGFVARFLGDETAWKLGRVSLNPIKHIDPFGTILLPGFLLLLGSPFLFGYAKPVPINFGALRNPRRDMVLVGRSGTSNEHRAGGSRCAWVSFTRLSSSQHRSMGGRKSQERNYPQCCP